MRGPERPSVMPHGHGFKLAERANSAPPPQETVMLGLMMDRPLTIASLARHAERNHGQREVVSVTADHERHRYRFAD